MEIVDVYETAIKALIDSKDIRTSLEHLEWYRENVIHIGSFDDFNELVDKHPHLEHLRLIKASNDISNDEATKLLG